MSYFPSKSFNYDLVDIRTSPLAPPTTRTSYQELALNSRESKGAGVFPRIAGYFRFSSLISPVLFGPPVSRSKSKSFNKRLLPSVVARTLAWAATKCGKRWRSRAELNACSFVTVTNALALRAQRPPQNRHKTEDRVV